MIPGPEGGMTLYYLSMSIEANIYPTPKVITIVYVRMSDIRLVCKCHCFDINKLFCLDKIFPSLQIYDINITHYCTCHLDKQRCLIQTKFVYSENM